MTIDVHILRFPFGLRSSVDSHLGAGRTEKSEATLFRMIWTIMGNPRTNAIVEIPPLTRYP